MGDESTEAKGKAQTLETRVKKQKKVAATTKAASADAESKS